MGIAWEQALIATIHIPVSRDGVCRTVRIRDITIKLESLYHAKQVTPEALGKVPTSVTPTTITE